MLKNLLACLALLLVLPLAARDGNIFDGYLGSSASTVVYAPTATINISAVVLQNDTGSDVTGVNVRDTSTRCNGGPCYLVPPDTTVPAKTHYAYQKWSAPAAGGIQAWAGTANAVRCTIVANLP